MSLSLVADGHKSTAIAQNVDEHSIETVATDENRSYEPHQTPSRGNSVELRRKWTAQKRRLVGWQSVVVLTILKFVNLIRYINCNM